MRNAVVKVIVAAVVVAGVVALPGVAYAANACYRYDDFPSERLMINVADYATLVTGQTVYKVHGKEVGGAGGGTIAAVYGTVLVNKNVANQPDGAHMGFQDNFLAGGTFVRLFDCTSTELSPTPSTWTCSSMLLSGSFTHDSARFTKIPNDAACLVFEDLPSEAGSSSGK